jgi:hypothetical protein
MNFKFFFWYFKNILVDKLNFDKLCSVVIHLSKLLVDTQHIFLGFFSIQCLTHFSSHKTFFVFNEIYSYSTTTKKKPRLLNQIQKTNKKKETKFLFNKSLPLKNVSQFVLVLIVVCHITNYAFYFAQNSTVYYYNVKKKK